MNSHSDMEDTDELNEQEISDILRMKDMIMGITETNTPDSNTDETQINFNIFIKWMKNNWDVDDLYNKFTHKFSPEYRSQLYDDMIKYFNDSTLVTDELLYYWKVIVVYVIIQSNKYNHCNEHIVIDLENKSFNIVLYVIKGIFKCVIEDSDIYSEHLCYFKDNGNDYYVS